MTRKNYVIVSTTGVVLFLISIPWFLLVKGHLMLEPPYFRVDPRFVQSAKLQEDMLSDRVAVGTVTRRDEVVKKPTVSPVQLINLPAVRVGALASVEPSMPSASTPETASPDPAKPASPAIAAPARRQTTVAPIAVVEEPQVPAAVPPTDDRVVTEAARNEETRYGIQVAAFKRKASAQKLASKHEKTGTEVHIVKRHIAGRTWYRVILGSYANKDDAMVFDRILQEVLGDTETQLVQFKAQSSRKGKVDSK